MHCIVCFYYNLPFCIIENMMYQCFMAIHMSIRRLLLLQKGSLCAFPPPHSKKQAAATTTRQSRRGKEYCECVPRAVFARCGGKSFLFCSFRRPLARKTQGLLVGSVTFAPGTDSMCLFVCLRSFFSV